MPIESSPEDAIDGADFGEKVAFGFGDQGFLILEGVAESDINNEDILV